MYVPQDLALGHRRSIRLPHYDYASPGGYFITLCIHQRRCLLGDVVHGDMHGNDAARMVQTTWEEMPSFYQGVSVDVFQAMPNHVHGIVITTNVDTGRTRGSAPTVSTLVQRFKTLTTNRYIAGVREHGWTPFQGHLWQRDCYEHVVRDERELSLTREYIVANPAQWAHDRENPDKQ